MLICSGGSGEVAFNVIADNIIYNEKSKPMVDIFKSLDDDFVNDVDLIINKWNLSKENKQQFLDLRKYYNENRNSLDCRTKSTILYCLITHAFNYQLAFNSKREYNMPSGAGRSYFSPQLKTKLINYIERKNKINISFTSNDFCDFDIKSISNPEKVFIYADPPYLITTGAYERDYFCKWSEEYEYMLLDMLDDLDANGYKFALSNVLEHKGKSNEILKAWAKKYNIHYLEKDYKNCNYQTKDKSANSSIEVLITNY